MEVLSFLPVLDSPPFVIKSPLSSLQKRIWSSRLERFFIGTLLSRKVNAFHV